MPGSERIVFAEAGVAEVELDAHELLKLAPVRATGEAARGRARPDAAPTHDSRANRARSATPQVHARNENPAAPGSRRMLFAGLAAVALASAIVALLAGEDGAPAPAAGHAPPVEWTPVPDPDAALAPEAELPPVLFTNPFDETEVFEFPPGTTQEQARQAVADFLLQRARDRYRRGELGPANPG
ncbi:MAG: hypothetical protein DIU71_04535 [Proteobacteria bacterium]|nr:MAG: hypothetical protein DIU71_04535 [Pseudomonadota bacterium]